jgi:hypothetical protein
MFVHGRRLLREADVHLPNYYSRGKVTDWLKVFSAEETIRSELRL